MATFKIKDVYNITGIGIVIVGIVEDGIIKPGMKSRLDSNDLLIKSMQVNHNNINEARSGSNIAINIKVIDNKSGFFKKLFYGNNQNYNFLKNNINKSIYFS